MGKDKDAVGTVAGTQIFKATYSGVPVYEMICKTVAVMRRKSDGWLNATQILKVAGFDKPQRTRVLEREVQKGEHEKVQGGYGKYQGTWIPVERGLMLSKQYNVEDLMRPIIDYVPTAQSPPQAPKHITAAPTARVPKKPKVVGAPGATPTKTTHSIPSTLTSDAATPLRVLPKGAVPGLAPGKAESLAAAEKKAKKDREKAAGMAARMLEADGDVDVGYDLAQSPSSADDESGGESPASRRSSSSRSPSPILGSDDPVEGRVDDTAGVEGDVNGKKRKFTDGYEPAAKRAAPFGEEAGGGGLGQPMQYLQPQYSHPVHSYAPAQQEFLGPERYEDIILDYFITETSSIPSILVSPPADYDANASIDDDGHTALHWACAMGRIRVVKLLLAAGADIFRVNHSEQTPLMRSVMFSNNYDVRKFPELYELLHRSTLNIDKNNRTVFHHIADVALSKGKTHAARYYMETILGRLAQYPKELGDVVNFQDDEGETAITLAARARSKRLVKALLDHGADPKLANRDGKTAEDYILEDERFRSSPIGGGGASIANGVGSSSAQAAADRAGPGSNNGHLTNPNYINHQPPGSSSTAGVAGPSRLDPLAPPPARRIYHSTSAQLAAGKTTSEVTNLLATLARSYDDELQTREREINHANGLLTTITAELAETRRRTEAMRSKLGGQLQADHARLTALEKALEEKMECDFAAGWMEWSAGEHAREAAYLSNPASLPPADAEDLSRLLSVPSTDGEIGEERAALSQELDALRGRRRELFGMFVALESGLGTGEKMSKYRRIIRASAGSSSGDPDELIVGLLQNLEAEGRAPKLTRPLGAGAPATPISTAAPLPP